MVPRFPDDSRAAVVSDVHFEAIPEEHQRRFLDFLERLPGNVPALVVAGDLFDFWFEYRSVIPRRPFSLLRALADVADAGVRVVMVGGNHDAWGGEFLREEVGVEWLARPAEMEVGGRTVFVAHGDGLTGGNRVHGLLRRLASTGPAVRLFRAVHPDLALWLAEAVSRTPSVETEPTERERRQGDRLAALAADLLRERPHLDLVVFGHAQLPEARETEPGRYYLNPGDWIRHLSYGVVTGSGVAVRRWEETDQ